MSRFNRDPDAAPPNPFLLAAEAFRMSGGAEYYSDPVGFATEVIQWKRGEGLTPYQREAMQLLQDERRLALRGPHGLGKTTLNALLVIWFALTRESEAVDWKVPTTAGSWRQLEFYLWPEIHKWVHRLDWNALGIAPFNPITQLTSLRLKLRHGAAFAVAASDPQKLEGVHADSVLYVFDESKIVSPQVFDAAEGAFSAARMVGVPEAFAIATSTPGVASGRFYELHQGGDKYRDWVARHVTVDETLAAGRVSQDWVAARAAQWGADSAIYANRVLGEFHDADEDGIIPLSWVEAANERWIEWDNAGRVEPEGHRRYFGCDVSYSGKDLTVIATRVGNVFYPLQTMAVADTTKISGRLMLMMTRKTDTAVVDVIGVGAGVYDQIRSAGLSSMAFSAATRSYGRDRSRTMGFLNSRAEMWWRMREELDPAFEPTLALPPDDALIEELTAPRWKLHSSNKIQVESKDEIRKRLRKSTDHADAVCQALFPERVGVNLMADPTVKVQSYVDPSDTDLYDAEESGFYSWR